MISSVSPHPRFGGAYARGAKGYTSPPMETALGSYQFAQNQLKHQQPQVAQMVAEMTPLMKQYVQQNRMAGMLSGAMAMLAYPLNEAQQLSLIERTFTLTHPDRMTSAPHQAVDALKVATNQTRRKQLLSQFLKQAQETGNPLLTSRIEQVIRQSS